MKSIHARIDELYSKMEQYAKQNKIPEYMKAKEEWSLLCQRRDANACRTNSADTTSVNRVQGMSI